MGVRLRLLSARPSVNFQDRPANPVEGGCRVFFFFGAGEVGRAGMSDLFVRERKRKERAKRFPGARLVCSCEPSEAAPLSC